MPRQYVFVVHGMGLHPTGTGLAPFREAILAALGQYAPFTGLEDEEIERTYLRLVPLSYDDIFEGYRTRWRDLGSAIGAAQGLGLPEVTQALEALGESAGSDATFDKILWEKVLDPLLWHVLPEARMAVIARVCKQMGDALVEWNDEMKSGKDKKESRLHIVAHSLGTSVIHDALISLRFLDLPGNPVGGQGVRMQTVAMLANVSRLLEDRFDLGARAKSGAYDVYHSCLNPGAEDALCARYLNFHHKADPFTWPREFNPIWADAVYKSVETARYKNLQDVHDFELYFSDPYVHVPLIRAIFRNLDYCTPDEVIAAVTSFKQEHPHVAGSEFDDLRELFHRDPDHKLSVRELVDYLVRAYRKLTA